MSFNVFLLGGGTRLAAHLGALEAIERTVGKIDRWAGASAGSLVAAVRASGHSHEQAVELMLSTDYRQFFELRPLELLRGYGLCSGRKLEKWVHVVLKGARFRDLEAPLSIVTTDIVTGEPFLFSNDATPDAFVSEAVRCSVGIPGLFTVKRLKDVVLVDGGLTPIDEAQLFPAEANARTLTIRLVRDKVVKAMQVGGMFGWASYAQRIASLLLDAGDDPRCFPSHSDRVLSIRTGPHSAVDFDLTENDKRDLYDRGFRQCQELLVRQKPVPTSELEQLLAAVDGFLARPVLAPSLN
jgi:NTE family protein